MQCPRCGSLELKVIDSRSIGDGIRRRRECLSCYSRFTTVERLQSKSIFIVKKDDRREEFNREKLLSGIRKACEKRSMPTGSVEKIVDDIESDLYQMGKIEIPSTIVGDKVIERLKEIDPIAYIRFASVYFDFADITSLKHAVDTLVEARASKPPADQLYLLSDELLNSHSSRGRRAKR